MIYSKTNPVRLWARLFSEWRESDVANNLIFNITRLCLCLLLLRSLRLEKTSFRFMLRVIGILNTQRKKGTKPVQERSSFTVVFGAYFYIRTDSKSGRNACSVQCTVL